MKKLMWSNESRFTMFQHDGASGQADGKMKWYTHHAYCLHHKPVGAVHWYGVAAVVQVKFQQHYVPTELGQPAT